MQHGRGLMTGERNYIEVISAMRDVDAGKKAGKSVADVQKSMPLSSIKAFQADN